VFLVNPDVVFTFTRRSPIPIRIRIWDVGITGVPMADHFEPTPLGRSEWMKLLALFFNREREAEQEFPEVEARYVSLTAMAASVERFPP
jgi:iron complex transport system substrate-binding protein